MSICIECAGSGMGHSGPPSVCFSCDGEGVAPAGLRPIADLRRTIDRASSLAALQSFAHTLLDDIEQRKAEIEYHAGSYPDGVL